MTDPETTAGYRWESLSDVDRQIVDRMLLASAKAGTGLWPGIAPSGHDGYQQFSGREKMAAAFLELRKGGISNV